MDLIVVIANKHCLDPPYCSGRVCRGYIAAEAGFPMCSAADFSLPEPFFGGRGNSLPTKVGAPGGMFRCFSVQGAHTSACILLPAKAGAPSTMPTKVGVPSTMPAKVGAPGGAFRLPLGAHASACIYWECTL